MTEWSRFSIILSDKIDKFLGVGLKAKQMFSKKKIHF